MSDPSVTPEPILQVCAGLWAAEALKSGVDLQLFDALAAGPQDVAALSQTLCRGVPQLRVPEEAKTWRFPHILGRVSRVWPNQSTEPTAYSACCAPASGSSSCSAFGPTCCTDSLARENRTMTSRWLGAGAGCVFRVIFTASARS